MVLALFRTLEFKKLFYRYLYYKYWRFFLVLPKTILNHLTIDLLLYYLYCLCKFLKDRFFYDCCSFQKADAKVRTLKHIFQIIPEVFFIFLFSRRLSYRKGGKRKTPCAYTVSVRMSNYRCSRSRKRMQKYTIYQYAPNISITFLH